MRWLEQGDFLRSYENWRSRWENPVAQRLGATELFYISSVQQNLHVFLFSLLNITLRQYTRSHTRAQPTSKQSLMQSAEFRYLGSSTCHIITVIWSFRHSSWSSKKPSRVSVTCSQLSLSNLKFSARSPSFQDVVTRPYALEQQVHKFSENLTATYKFWAPDSWHDAGPMLRTHKYKASPYTV